MSPALPTPLPTRTNMARSTACALGAALLVLALVGATRCAA